MKNDSPTYFKARIKIQLSCERHKFMVKKAHIFWIGLSIYDYTKTILVKFTSKLTTSMIFSGGRE